MSFSESDSAGAAPPVLSHRCAEPHARFDGKLFFDEYPLERRVEFGLGDVGQKTQMPGVDAQKQRGFRPDVVCGAQHGAVAAENDHQIGALHDFLAGQPRFLSRHAARVQIEVDLEAPLFQPGRQPGEVERTCLRLRPCGQCNALNVRRHLMNLPNQPRRQGIPGSARRQPRPPFTRAPVWRRLFFAGADPASSGRRPARGSPRRVRCLFCSDNA